MNDAMKTRRLLSLSLALVGSGLRFGDRTDIGYPIVGWDTGLSGSRYSQTARRVLRHVARRFGLSRMHGYFTDGDVIVCVASDAMVYLHFVCDE